MHSPQLQTCRNAPPAGELATAGWYPAVFAGLVGPCSCNQREGCVLPGALKADRRPAGAGAAPPARGTSADGTAAAVPPDGADHSGDAAAAAEMTMDRQARNQGRAGAAAHAAKLLLQGAHKAMRWARAPGFAAGALGDAFHVNSTARAPCDRDSDPKRERSKAAVTMLHLLNQDAMSAKLPWLRPLTKHPPP